MDFNSIDPLNTDPQPDLPPPPADPTGFEHQLSELQDGAPPYATWSPVPQGEAYSPYLDAGHPYSSHWEDDLHTPAAVPPGQLPAAGESLLQLSSQQPIAQSLAEAADFDQDLIWQDLEPGPTQAEPSSAAGERFLQPSSQQPPAQSLAEAPDFEKDPVWQELEPRLLQAGPSHAAPSQAGPSSSTGGAPLELGNFVMENGRRANEYWVFCPQTATNHQLHMLRSVGLMPSKDSPTTFTILGVPHTAEWREEDFVRINPSLDPSLWPGYSGEDSPTR